ncbi:MAG: hypothetical protein LKJ88_03125 [Bacilli bacterium]|jgi:alpha-L-rhamnosidase|nr:hypothetical protein [Bacilli bacterium]
MPFFNKAQQVYPFELKDEMNISLLFVQDFLKETNMTLTISGNSAYQVFLNGNLVLYGPSKAAHHVYRVDSLHLDKLEAKNRLVIVLAGYNCCSFDRVLEPPFLAAELSSDGIPFFWTGRDFTCYRFTPRLQKVSRFSYQRCFSESYVFKQPFQAYRYGETLDYPKLKVSLLQEGRFIAKGVCFPFLAFEPFIPCEGGMVACNPKKKVYEDRYMVTEYLKIFPKATWEDNPNDEVSRFNYLKERGVMKDCQSDSFLTVRHQGAKTGFIAFKAKVIKKAKVYVVFDEINSSSDPKEAIGITFYRNTTQNIISYELAEGEYNLISFEPYTAQYIRFIVLGGEVEFSQMGMFLLENKEVRNAVFSLEDKKIEEVLKAAKETLAQNSVDILTDCPSRERAGWLCDSYFSSRAEKLLTGNNRVERNFLENFADYVPNGDIPEGMLPMCYPADFKDHTYIPNWAMFYVLELDNYLTRNNDPDLKEKSKKNITGLLEFFKKYENEDGLLENLENWVFVEWSKENDPESISGVNFPSNMLYGAMLKAAGRLLEAKDLIAKGQKVLQTVDKLSFDGEFYHDNALRDKKGKLQLTERIGETTQYYAFYFQAADMEKRQALFQTLLTKFGPLRDTKAVFPSVYPSNVFIGDYLRLEIMTRYGLFEEVKKETIDYFYKMAKLTGTLWEHDSSFASLNHGFTSYIFNLIFSSLTGIVNIDYLKKEIYVKKIQAQGNFSFKLPLDNDFLSATTEGKKIRLLVPEGYKIIRIKD